MRWKGFSTHVLLSQVHKVTSDNQKCLRRAGKLGLSSREWGLWVAVGCTHEPVLFCSLSILYCPYFESFVWQTSQRATLELGTELTHVLSFSHFVCSCPPFSVSIEPPSILTQGTWISTSMGKNNWTIILNVLIRIVTLPSEVTSLSFCLQYLFKTTIQS